MASSASNSSIRRPHSAVTPRVGRSSPGSFRPGASPTAASHQPHATPTRYARLDLAAPRSGGQTRSALFCPVLLCSALNPAAVCMFVNVGTMAGGGGGRRDRQQNMGPTEPVVIWR